MGLILNKKVRVFKTHNKGISHAPGPYFIYNWSQTKNLAFRSHTILEKSLNFWVSDVQISKLS